MAYLLDSNVFITAKDKHYGLDFCPAFWEWLAESNSSGLLFSIEKVRKEILKQEDELADWCKRLPSSFFIAPDKHAVQELRTVANWVTSQNYTPEALADFLKSADYYLIAQALAGDHTVVTHEVPANSPTKVKIPTACQELGVDCKLPFAVIRSSGARFVLDG